MLDTLKRVKFDYRVINPNFIDETLYYEFSNKKKDLKYNCEFEDEIGLTFSKDDNFFKINSIAIIFIPYNSREYGNIAKYARGVDYHIKAKEIFEDLLESLKSKYPNNNFSYQCDKGEINERFYAGVSGLCMIGKNGMLIHEEYGSYGNIMLLFTDLKSKEYKTEIKGCLNCGKCMKACPVNSIKEDGINDSSICISYLTQKKVTLSNEEINSIKLGGYIFGCDICQDVCPLNTNVINNELMEKNNHHINSINLEDIISMSNKEFIRLYRGRAFSWRGRGVLERNAKILEEML
ncbi:MAG: epoxyqueuosine reductase [Filifactoraceae bacterium]